MLVLILLYCGNIDVYGILLCQESLTWVMYKRICYTVVMRGLAVNPTRMVDDFLELNT